MARKRPVQTQILVAWIAAASAVVVALISILPQVIIPLPQSSEQVTKSSNTANPGAQIEEALERLATTGPEHLLAREAAVLKLEQIAKTSRDHHWQVMDILTRFVRQRSPSVGSPLLTSKPKYVHQRRVDRSKPGLGQPVQPPEAAASDFFFMAFLRFKDDNGTPFRVSIYDEPLRKALDAAPALTEKIWIDVLPTADVHAAIRAIGRRKIEYDPQGAVLDLREVNLRNGDLSKAYLADANLERADLSDAVLDGACLSGANLSEAMLAGTRMGAANLREIRASGADFLISGFGNADLRGADFTGTRVRIFRRDVPPHSNRWQARVELLRINAYTSYDFAEWAVKHGAVTGAAPETWEKRKEAARAQWAAESGPCRTTEGG